MLLLARYMSVVAVVAVVAALVPTAVLLPKVLFTLMLSYLRVDINMYS